MTRASASTFIDAPPGHVAALYLDVTRWNQIFPLIRSARVVHQAHGKKVVEVDHIQGTVMNVLSIVSPTRVQLQEWKHRYDAVFINDFAPERGGTRYRLSAEIRLRGPIRVLSALVKPLAWWQMHRYTLDPMKRAAEASRPPGRA